MSLNKNMKKFVLADILLLLFLLLLSSTDFIVREKKTEIYRIAVWTDVPAGRQLENFRAGAAKAAVEWDVDISFLTLDDAENGGEILQREMETGCRGIIMRCGDSRQAEEMLADVPLGVPVVLYDSEGDSARIRTRVYGDMQEEGRLLAEAVLAGREKGESVTIVEPAQEGWYIKLLHDLTEEQLRQAGVLVRRVTMEETASAETFVKGMAAQGGNILVSGDAAILQALGEANRASSLPIYGAGFTGIMRELLEDGAIRGTVVHRDYEAGYLSVEQAAKILRGKGAAEETIIVESALVTAESIAEKDVESIVFPYI